MGWMLQICAFFVICGVSSTAKRILIVPFQMPSHIAELAAVAEALVDRGHEVHMLMGRNSPLLKKLEGTRAKVLHYEVTEKNGEGPKVDFKAMIFSGKEERPMDSYRRIPLSEQMCHDVLGDKALFNNIKELAFDFVIVDGIPFTQCLYVLPYKLDLPYATFTISIDPCQSTTPSLPSFAPLSMTFPKTDQMTFWQRLENTWDLIDWCYDQRVKSSSDEFVTVYAPEKPPLTIRQLQRKSQLWLLDSDMVLDYPRPTMPNEVYVGGLMIKEGKSLPEEFKQIVEGAKEGVIVMSFGSSAPDIKEDVFLEAFRKVKQTVLWRYTGEPLENVPHNVHLFKWLPQADLLAHPNVRLFITHCGANGQFESVYNGVPMLHFPFFAEQAYNALRSKHHGFGLTLKLATFTSEQLNEHIHEVINNPIYKNKVMKASQIIKSRPHSALQRAVYWIEHVMTHGADHLMAHSLHMPWYQLLMIDVFAFMLGVLIAAILVLICVIKLFCRICCGGASQKVKVN